jgi:hypothetical protein
VPRQAVHRIAPPFQLAIREDNMRKDLFGIIGIAVLAATPVLGQGSQQVREADAYLEFPGDVPGPPFYAQTSHMLGSEPEFYHTDEWIAVPFFRDPECVPEDFNLLDAFDLNAFGCTLTIQGFEIWPTPPSEGGLAPLVLVGWGLGAVPIYFIRWNEFQTAVADRLLTITELQALRSLRIGFASFFSVVNHPGLYTDPGVRMSGRGVLEDGRQFQFQAVAHGKSIVPKRVKIEFKGRARR